MQLILASKSKARIKMLKNAGICFETLPAEIDERKVYKETAEPFQIAEKLAEKKAQAVSLLYPDALVIGADQVLEFEGEVFTKASGKNEAIERLLAMSGREHKLVSSVALCQFGKKKWIYTDTASMVMPELGRNFLRDYSNRAGSALVDTVGGYEIEGVGLQLFKDIRGDFFTVMGMPLLPLVNQLRKLGILQK
jgi:septum formation protein